MEDPQCCWKACNEYANAGGQEALESLRRLVANAEALQSQWCRQFTDTHNTPTQPAIICLLPIAHTDPNTIAFRTRLAFAKHMLANTSYAAPFLAAHLNPQTIRRTAALRSGRKTWPAADPLITILREAGVIVIIPKKR